MQNLPVGIDLGTSTSIISVFRDGAPEPVPDFTSLAKSPIVPSIVALDPRGRVVVGERARTSYKNNVREVKRAMENPEPIALGDQEYRPEQISAMILKKLKDNGEALHGPIQDVVISVPAIFTEVGKNNTKQAAKLAGLNAIDIISEPTAAALAYGIRDLDADEKVLVFDFGGGTLDISIVEMMGGVLNVNGTYGDRFLGGKDFDDALIALILSKFKEQEGDLEIPPVSLQDLKQEAESCKVALSEFDEHGVELFNFAVQDGIPVDLLVDITKAEFEEACAPLLARTKEVLLKSLEVTNTNLDSINRVLLVGGTTYIPAVRELLASVFTCPLAMDVPPDLAVAMGTAIRANMLTKTGPVEETDLILVDSYPYGIGVDMLTDRGLGVEVVYEPLSLPNTVFPYSVTKDFSLNRADQDTLRIQVFQTLDPKTTNLDDASFTGISAVIEDIPHSPTGMPHPIKVDFNVDADQTISLNASIPTTGQSASIEFSTNDLRAGAEELEKLQQELDELY